MGQQIYSIPNGYADCELIVDNIFLVAHGLKFIVYYPQTLYRPAFQGLCHET